MDINVDFPRFVEPNTHRLNGGLKTSISLTKNRHDTPAIDRMSSHDRHTIDRMTQAQHIIEKIFLGTKNVSPDNYQRLRCLPLRALSDDGFGPIDLI